jgi:hypothetical protein
MVQDGVYEAVVDNEKLKITAARELCILYE